MVHDGREGLKGWIRTTWLPYTERVPIKSNAKVYVEMVRLEVEAEKLG